MLLQKFGKYLLLERVAIGGMAEVFVAKIQSVAGFEKILAIKKILPDLIEDNEFVDMFIREAKLAAEISHENIAHIYDFGKIKDSYFIAMEYVSGLDLRTILKKSFSLKKKIPIEVGCQLILKVLDGMEYAHKKKGVGGEPLNIIHRDISPQNILVTFDGSVKIIDFGIAKTTITNMATQKGMLKGKFGYMSPEQSKGSFIDQRSDLFSAGIVLYELLTSSKLYTAKSDMLLLDKVRNAYIPDMKLINPTIPNELIDITKKALKKNPNERFQSADEFKSTLIEFLGNNSSIYASGNIIQRYLEKEFAEEEVAEQKRMEKYRKEVVMQDMTDDDGSGEQPPDFQKEKSVSRVSDSTSSSFSQVKGQESTHSRVIRIKNIRVVYAMFMLIILLGAAVLTLWLNVFNLEIPALGLKRSLTTPPITAKVDDSQKIPKRGSLQITVHPDQVKINIDGKTDYDKSPLKLTELGAGKHLITITPQIKGYKVLKKEIEIIPDQQVALHLELEQEKAVEEKDKDKEKDKEKEKELEKEKEKAKLAEKEKRAEKKAEEKDLPASVYVNSNERAAIIINGAYSGTYTPYTIKLKKGDHTISLKYRDKVFHVQPITVADGKYYNVFGRYQEPKKEEIIAKKAVDNKKEGLEKKIAPPLNNTQKVTQPLNPDDFGYINVTSRPRAVTIIIDGSITLPGPIVRKYKIAAGNHVVTLVFADGQKETRTVSVKKDQFSWVMVNKEK